MIPAQKKCLCLRLPLHFTPQNSQLSSSSFGETRVFPELSRSLLHLYSPQNNKRQSIFFWGKETNSENYFAHLKQTRGGVAEGVEGRGGGGPAEDEMRRRKSRGKLSYSKNNHKNKVERGESGGSLAFADPWRRPSSLSQTCLRLLIRMALGGTNSRSAFCKRPGQKGQNVFRRPLTPF